MDEMMKNAILIVLLLIVIGTISEIKTSPAVLPRSRRKAEVRSRITCNGDEDCTEGETCLRFLNRCFSNPSNKWLKRQCFTNDQCPARKSCNVFTGECTEKNWWALRKAKIAICILGLFPCQKGYKCKIRSDGFLECTEESDEGSNEGSAEESSKFGLEAGIADYIN